MQISTGLRSYQPSPTPLPVSQAPQNRSSEGEAARWFVKHYPELTQLSDEYIDKQGRHLCLWQGPEGLLATVYDSRHQTFNTLSGSQIRNALNPHEPPHILQARLASSSCVQWDLVLLGHTIYVWPRLRAAAWQDFIPTDGTMNKPNAAFKGTNSLTQAMGVLYKDGFTTSETARLCIEYQHQDKGQKYTVVTELTTTNHNKTPNPEIKNLLNNNEGKILAVSLYDRQGNTKAGLEFRHPQDKSQTTFHADFSESRAHMDVRVGNGQKIPQEAKKIYFQEFGGRNLNPKEFSQFVRNGGRYPDGPGGGGSGSKSGGGGGNSGSAGGGARSGGAGGGKSGAGGGSTASFQNNLNQNGLTKSYNSTNPNNPLLETAHQQDIGGVAVANPNAILLNMNSSLYDLTAKGYWLAFPFLTDGMPFSNEVLQQIIRSLAQNIYIHHTFPFYSLHFTKEGSLYSVIHPGYQNTPIGEVIGMLDYFMKGYLNGGYFNQSDLIRFAQDKFWLKNEDRLTPSIQSMDKLYKQTFKDDSEYTALMQLLRLFHIQQYGVEIDKTTLNKIQQRFQISFRIIAKQEQIEKHGSTLLFHGGMDVLYTIECYRVAIDQVEQYKGSDEYQMLDGFCAYVANDIKNRLPQLAPCQDNFKKLNVICALSYYLSSLKQQEMVPKLKPVKADVRQTCPGLFPPYPRAGLEPEVNLATLWDVFQRLSLENKALFDQFLLQKTDRITPELQTALGLVIQKLMPKEAFKFIEKANTNELVLLLINQVFKRIAELKEQLFSVEINQQRQELMAAQRKAQDNIEEHEAMRLSLDEELDAALMQIQEKKRENIASQTRELEQSINQQLQDIEQFYIGYDQVVTFEGWHYPRGAEPALRRAMRRSLAKKSEQLLQQLNDEIKAHWSAQRTQIVKTYQELREKLTEHILNVSNALKQISEELLKIDTMRRSINTSLNHQVLAEAIPLALPTLVKKPPIFATTDGTPSVRIHGGTGFRLEGQSILLNTALVISLSQQLEADAHLATLSEKEPGEVWKTVTINNQSYQAFYIKHASVLDNSALEQSLIKPNMASTAMEKRWMQLVAQDPSAAQLDAVTEFIALNKPKLNITDAYGNTALHLAAMNNNLALATLLLKHDVKIDVLNQFGNSPLHVASMYGHNKIINAIYQANQDSLRQLTMNDESALYLAVLHHRLETVKLLVSYGLDVNEVGINGIPIIYTALYHHSYEISDYLLSDPSIDVHFQLENGNTLLHLAVLVNAQTLIPQLLSKRVDINVYNRDGKTPLHIAVALGYLDLVKQLLNHQRKSALGRSDSAGSTPYVVKFDNVKKLTNQHKSALEQTDSANNTPLYLAIRHHQQAVSDYLLKIGAKTNPLIDGANALTHALKTGQVSVAKAILKANQFKLNTDNQIDQDNFLLMCKLGLWRLCKQIIATDPQWVTQTLTPDHAEPNCYIDYLCQHNRIEQWNYLFRNFKARTVAYLKAHAGKLYKLAVKHRSHEMLSQLQLQFMLQCVANPYSPSSKLFEGDRFVSYSDYDLIQFAVRYGLPQFYEPYIAHAQDQAALKHPTADGKNLLYLAAESGNYALIKTLLEKQVSLVAPNGRHFFYALIEHNYPDIIRRLLSDESYRSSFNINGWVCKNEKIRVIDLAFKLGNLKMATSLIQCGAEVDEPNQYNKLPIHYAIENNAPHLIRLSFKYEIGDLGKILRHAIRLHKHAVFLQLLKNGLRSKKEILDCANALLVTAIKHHNVVAYRFLISLGAKVDNALLHQAITDNAYEIIPLLIAAGCDRQTKENGLTPLMLACKLKHDLCVRALIQGSPLSQSEIKPSQWIALILAGKTTAINQDFMTAIKDDDPIKLKKLITLYEPIKASELPIQYAPITLEYLYQGEKINSSLLGIAILENKPKIIKYLLKHGYCDPYTFDSLGLSAVHRLMKLSDAQFIVQLIEQFKLNINHFNPKNGYTPLHMAVLKQNPAMADYLMTNGANKYAETADGKTALHIAIEQKDLAFVKRAIEQHGYDLHHKTSLQECPLAIALKTGNLEIAQYLVESGADINGINGFKQRTMLHYAVMSHDAKVVFYVLSCGVQSKVQDNIGMLPVHLAAKQGDREIVDLLDDIEEREEQEGGQAKTMVSLTDLRNRDARDFALIHQHIGLSAYLTQKHQLPSRNKPTLDKPIGFKEYKEGGKTPLELAIQVGDQVTAVKLTKEIAKENGTSLIKKAALKAASASQNFALFSYVMSELWDGQDQHILQDCLASAIISNCVKNVKHLLSKLGENHQNIIFDDGSTPIVLACMARAHDVLKELLTQIKPHHQEIYAAFQSLIRQDQLVMAKLLYACDPTAIHATDTNGETLLHHAVKHNRPNMLAFFILCGCVDRENYVGQTALSQAMKANQTECIKYLSTAYPKGMTAGLGLLQYIAREQRLDYAMLNWLCHSQDVNAQDEGGQTALHYVIQRQDFRAVDILLSHQANITLTNQHNQDALALASADPSMFAKLANSANLPQVIWGVSNSHKNDRISVIKELLASTKKDHHYLYKLLTHVVNIGSAVNVKYYIELYHQLYPDAPSLLESAYQAYRRSEDLNQETHMRVLSWLLENHSNPYTAFGSKLAEIKTKPKLGRIYQAWYNNQWKTLTECLNHNLQFKSIDGILEMLKSLMPQIEASCAQANTYDDASWVLLFVFLDAAIIQASDVAPKALITAMQSVVTPTGQDIIRKAVAQPYLQNLIASVRSSAGICAIL